MLVGQNKDEQVDGLKALAEQIQTQASALSSVHSDSRDVFQQLHTYFIMIRDLPDQLEYAPRRRELAMEAVKYIRDQTGHQFGS